MTDTLVTLEPGDTVTLALPAIIQPPEPSDWAPVIQSKAGDALLKGRHYVLPDRDTNLICETPIVLEFSSGRFGGGIVGGGRSILESHVPDGVPVFTLRTLAPVGTSYAALEGLVFERFQIRGTGAEGPGIVLDARAPSASIHNFRFRDVTVMGCQEGWHSYNNVFEGGFDNCYALRNREEGAVWENDPTKPGVISAVQWVGGAVRENGSHGFATLGWARGLSCQWVQFIGNLGYAINAPNGWEAAENCTGENNCNVPTAAEWSAFLAAHPGAVDPFAGKRWTGGDRAAFRIDNYLGVMKDCRFPTGYTGDPNLMRTNGFQDNGLLSFVVGNMAIGHGCKVEGYGDRATVNVPKLAKLSWNSTGTPKVFVAGDTRGEIVGGVRASDVAMALYTKP